MFIVHIYTFLGPLSCKRRGFCTGKSMIHVGRLKNNNDGICQVTLLTFSLFTWQLAAKLKDGRNKGAFDVHQNKIKVHGTNANVTHTINEDERSEFTRHINGVLAGDVHIGNRFPIPTNTMQLFDECKGNSFF